MGDDLNTNDLLQIDSIAIVGTACRLPGDVSHIEDLWQLVINKKDGITEMPENRIPNFLSNIDAKRGAGKIVTAKGGFLKDIGYFDADFFDISPKEAEKIDPQQRLLLETSFNAIEDAGISLEELNGSNTGVFIASWTNDFEHRLQQTGTDVDVYATTGTGRYALSGRLSFFYNLQGPSLTVDTACSSSLVATHLAMQSLKSGECDIAIVGAANVILDTFVSVGYSRSGLLSDYGGCYFGNKNPGGYVRSEGSAVIVLKRTNDALRDGNDIYALLRASSCNNDGQAGRHMLSPGTATQEVLMNSACKQAGINPSAIQYIEAHGTGTKAGDIAEINAIWRSFGQNRNQKLYIGSVKSNIGHTEAVAGFAGLFKLLMALKNKTIPPDIHLYEKNPKINWEAMNIEIPLEALAWPQDSNSPIITGVNSFGVTGTNAFVLVQEYENIDSKQTNNSFSTRILPLSISANSNKSFYSYIKSYNEIINESNWKNVISNIVFHKTNLKYRKVILYNNYTELKETLKDIKQQTTAGEIIESDTYFKHPKIAFVFPGQGAQWQGMGKALYLAEPVFKDSIEQIRTAILNYADWDLTEALFTDEDRLTDIAIIQPALVAIEIALAKLWMHYGIMPHAVVGHSMGEVAAAYISGSISIDEAACIICTRSKLMRKKSGMGAMAYIASPHAEVQKFLDSNNYKHVHIGVVNSPKSAVITGDAHEIEQIVAAFEKMEIFSKLIKVDVASHSYQMDELKPELKQQLGHVQPKQPNIDFYSTVLGHKINNTISLDATYWADNLREPVQFANTVQALLADGIQLFIEVSPHPVLTQAIEENIESASADAVVIESTERDKDDVEQFTRNLAKAFCNGAFVNWRNFYGSQYEKIRLPEYPWQKEYYWLKEEQNVSGKTRLINGHAAHPFLQRYSYMAEGIKTHIWESVISLASFPFLSGHKIGDTVVFPAAAFLEIGYAAYRELTGFTSCKMDNISIRNPLYLKEDSSAKIKIVLQQKIGDLYSFGIYADDETEHFVADILLKEKHSEAKKFTSSQLPHHITGKDHYANCANIQLNYEQEFIAIQDIRYDADLYESAIELQADDGFSFYFHPAWLDAMLQTALVPAYLDSQTTYIPYFAKSLTIIKQPQGVLGHAKVYVIQKAEDKYCFKLEVYDEVGLCAVFEDLIFKRLEQKDTLIEKEKKYYRISTIKADFTALNEKNPILIIHNNLGSENIYEAFVNRGFHTSFLDIENYTTESFKSAINQANITPDTQLIFIPDNIDTWEDADSVMDAQQNSILPLSYLMQALAQTETIVRLWCITQHAQSIDSYEELSATYAMIPAFMRVLWNEHFELKPSTIDIYGDADIAELPEIIHQSCPENELIIRNKTIHAVRLEHDLIIHHQPEIVAGDIPFETSMREVGVIDNLFYKIKSLPVLQEDEIHIEVEAAGINFMNLMSVLGIYPGKVNGFGTLGIECVGTIKAKGSAVHHFNIGDRVFGMAYHTLTSDLITNAASLTRVPDGFSVDELVTIPVVFLTVYYSLVEQARIRKGEKVLIHAATGGVGLAAIQICRLYECEIYATAGSETKRQYLREMGILHVYDSRSLDFYDEILRDTEGKGVDVVLNSLSGEALYKSLDLLDDFGRFVEIGKKDVYDNTHIGLKVFKKSLSYFMVDLEKMLFERPEILGELMIEISSLLSEKSIMPLPYTAFGIAEVKDAFHMMQTSSHIGKIIIRFNNKEHISIEDNGMFRCLPQATYLITGGYGGLGMAFANMLAENGAGNIILIGRSAPKEQVLLKIEELRMKGVNIITAFADVSDYDALKSIIETIDSTTPLKGVFHMAGLLDDSAIANLTSEQFYKVLSPKIAGAINLHELTKNLDLDVFVLFSSSTVLFGSPGQAAYVSANAFMDALAYKRRQLNLPAQSIQWSTISDAGMAAFDDNKTKRLLEEGILPLTTKEATSTYQFIAYDEHPTIGAFQIDVLKWQQTYLSAKANPYFSQLTKDAVIQYQTNAAVTFREELLMLNDNQLAENKVEEKLKEMISKTTKIHPDKITSSSTFKSLGVDSLMSIQLKNQLEKTFELSLSVTAFWNHSSIKAYTRFLMDKLQVQATVQAEQINKISTNEIKPAADASKETIGTTTDELDELSKLLDDELNAL